MEMCQCGCGKEVTKEGNKTLVGHNKLLCPDKTGKDNHYFGKYHSEEVRNKMRGKRPQFSGKNNSNASGNATRGMKFPKELYPNFGSRNKIMPKRVERKIIQCLNCNMDIEIKVTEERKFCDNSCSSIFLSNDKEERKRRKIRMKKYWNDPEWRKNKINKTKKPKEMRKCLFCKKEMIELLKSTRQFCSYQCCANYRWNDPELRIKYTEINRKSIAKLWSDPEYRKKASALLKINSIKIWNSPKIITKMRKSRNMKPNIPEKYILDLIMKNDLTFNYVGDFNLWFKGDNHKFNPDYVDEKNKKIIEFFGDYWHNKPDVIIKDKERISTYKNFGYQVLILHDIDLKDEKRLVTKLKKFNNK